jgi:transcription termination factor NusB
MLADNSSHLRAAARTKRTAARQRAIEALARFEADNTPVTVTALAKAASVARSWIYTQPDLIERIATASERPTKTAPTRTTDESWQRRLELAHQRIRALTEENKQLRTQLALAHGQRRAEQIAPVRTLSSRQTR